MHTVVLGWFGASVVWILPLLWRVVKSALPGGSGLRGPGTIRLWIGFFCVLLSSSTLEGILASGIETQLDINRGGRALGGLLASVAHTGGAGAIAALVLAIFAPWVVEFTWRSVLAWADEAFGFGLPQSWLTAREKPAREPRPKRKARDSNDKAGWRERRAREKVARESKERAESIPSRVAPDGPTLGLPTGKQGRYSRPTVWRPPSTAKGAASRAAMNTPTASAAVHLKRPEFEMASGGSGKPVPMEPVAPAGWLNQPQGAARGSVSPGARPVSGDMSLSERSAAGSGSGSRNVGPNTSRGSAGTSAASRSGDVLMNAVGTPRQSTPARTTSGTTQRASDAAAHELPPGTLSTSIFSRSLEPLAPPAPPPPAESVQATLRSIQQNAALWTSLAGASAGPSHDATEQSSRSNESADQAFAPDFIDTLSAQSTAKADHVDSLPSINGIAKEKASRTEHSDFSRKPIDARGIARDIGVPSVAFAAGAAAVTAHSGVSHAASISGAVSAQAALETSRSVTASPESERGQTSSVTQTLSARPNSEPRAMSSADASASGIAGTDPLAATEAARLAQTTSPSASQLPRASASMQRDSEQAITEPRASNAMPTSSNGITGTNPIDASEAPRHVRTPSPSVSQPPSAPAQLQPASDKATFEESRLTQTPSITQSPRAPTAIELQKPNAPDSALEDPRPAHTFTASRPTLDPIQPPEPRFDEPPSFARFEPPEPPPLPRFASFDEPSPLGDAPEPEAVKPAQNPLDRIGKQEAPRLLSEQEEPETPASNVVRFPITTAIASPEKPETPEPPAAASRAPVRGFTPTEFEFHAPHASAVELPTLDLLEPASEDAEPVSEEQLADTGQLIEHRLQEFKVPVTVVGASAGPVITRFEVEPALGVRGSQIVGLMKDLSRGLGLTSIRVVETIPGKTCMGLELPNAKRQMIRLSEILEQDVYRASKSNLTIAMGKDIIGNPVVTDLAKAPHMLVAGTTGSGKSVAVNAMILSLLYKAKPEDVRLIMIDPKMLELSVYEGIPHLLAPVVTDMKLASNALNWCVGEMEKRYRLMSAVGVRNLQGFNHKIRTTEAAGKKLTNPFSLTPDAPEPLSTLPLIVVIIDELADLMMVAGKQIEQLIARLAQKARAAGIHLILATQRPSVDVITGLIKANIPTRVAFQVSSKIDSRTILDQMGAESLLGAGDMLFLPPGTGYPQRIHGAFVADDEVHRVVEYLKQFGEPEYEEGILSGPTSEGASQDLFGDAPEAEADPLYDEAVAFVLRTRRASISSVQRQLRIGYNRAARLVEQMETAGLVSPMSTNGNREVLAPPGPGE